MKVRRRWLIAAAAVGGSAAGMSLFLLRQRQPRLESLGDGKHLVMLSAPKPLPALRFADDNGRTLHLDHFRGKLVLLNIWATWCPPCVAEMPSLDRLQAMLGGGDFEVVALSIDAGGAGLNAVRRFFESVGIRYLRVYHDASGKAGFDLGAFAVPTTLLLNGLGHEIGRITGEAAWDSPEAIATIRRQLAAHR